MTGKKQLEIKWIDKLYMMSKFAKDGLTPMLIYMQVNVFSASNPCQEKYQNQQKN